MKFVALTCAAIFAVGSAVPIYAHHNWQAIYDIDSDIEVAGTIDSIHWKNPHVTMTIKVPTASGGSELWTTDTSSVATITRMGLERDMLSEGLPVRIAGYKSRRSDAAIFLTNMLLPGNEEMIFRRGVSPRWSEDFVGNPNPNPMFVSEPDINKRPDSIFSVWTTIWGEKDSHYVMPFDSGVFNMTPTGIKKSASVDLLNDHPLFACAPKGMPFAMTQPYPIKLTDNGDTITLNIEEYDGVRTIYLKQEHDDSAVQPSLMGYSTGRWEGQTLHVKTSKIAYDWAAIGTRPTPLISQSQQMYVEESFTLNENREHLDYTLRIEDPVMLSAPMEFGKYFQYQPDAVLKSFECDRDEMFEIPLSKN